MAISYVNGSGLVEATSGTTIAALEINAVAGNFICAIISSYFGAVQVSSVSDTAGNSYSLIGESEGSDPNHNQGIWAAANINGNANNIVTATYASSVGYRKIAVAQFSGIATISPYDASATFFNDSTSVFTHTSNQTSTTNQNEELIVCGGVSLSLTGDVSAQDPYYIAHNQFLTGDGTVYLAYRIVNTIGQYAITVSSQEEGRLTMQVRSFKGLTVSSAIPRRALDGPFYGSLRGSVR